MAAIENVSKANTGHYNKALTDYPEVGIRFDSKFLMLACWLVAGLFLDGWAHNHKGADLDPIFTPWHALMYSGFMAVAIFLMTNHYRNFVKGHVWGKTLPRGYNLSLLGTLIFGLGGLLDLGWHAAFGIEQGPELLLSPTHYMLVIGVTLIVSAPLRAAWWRLNSGEQQHWTQHLPMLLSVSLMLATILFIYQFAVLHVWPLNISAGTVANSLPTTGDNLKVIESLNNRVQTAYQYIGALGIVSVSGLLVGTMLMLIRRWGQALPRFTFTFVLTFVSALLSTQTDLFFMIPAFTITGLVIDLLSRRLKPSSQNPTAHWVLSAVLPVVLFGLYFVTWMILGKPLQWRIHSTSGMVFIAAFVGMMVNVLVSQLPASQSSPNN